MNESYEKLRPRLALKLRGAQCSGYKFTPQVRDIGVLVEELENRNREMIQKVADEPLAVLPELDNHVVELAVKSYTPPRSRVMTEDQISAWANSIKKVEAEHDAAQGNAQMVALLRETLIVWDREIACLHAVGMSGAPRGITGMECKAPIITFST